MEKDASDAKSEQSKLTESHGSSPVKPARPHTSDEKAAVGTVYRLRAEKPTEPTTVEWPFAQSDISEVSVGNVDFTAELKDEGKLGLFLSRDRARREPEPITLNVVPYFNGIFHTIKGAMIHLLQKKSEFNNEDAENRINVVATQLAIGCCLITYLKLRNLIFLEFPSRYNLVSLKRPKVVTDLPVSAPFAFAIQQLGAVNIANLPQERRFVPVFPQLGHTFGIPTGLSWNPNLYAQAVDYARNLGLHFSVVDLKQKSGSSWWLLRQNYAEGVFELKVPLPEVNFTSAMALTHSLFLSGDQADPSNVIFNLDPVGIADYGYILRDPHHGINVTTFEVIDESAQDIVTSV